ncbi:MAG: hypothetical protein HY758_03235 [Nitrospirae bacterium]|nr:hypothetical protein [Nitrospirota bacterium]
MREETAVETPYNKLNLVDDYVASFYYDPAADQTKAARCIDSDGDGDIDENDDGECDLSADDKTLETIGNIWEAGIQLWKRDISTDARRIFTTLDGSNWLANGFTATNASTLMTYLQASTDTEAEDIINWTLGQDISGFRSRTVAIDWNNDDDDGTPDGDTGDTGEGAKVWKLGDILDSTPKISSWIALNNYHKDERYNDSTYSDYLSSSNYKDRGMVFSGGNDGMLHAFKLGKLEIQENVNKPAGAAYQCTLTGTDMACLSNPDGYLGGPNVPLGSERWAFIPKNALPYLKYMADDSYCHVYSIDLAPYIFDASIGTEGCTETDYADCSKLGVDDPTKRWRTILIGGMRFGGACRNAGTACNGGTDDCIKTPIDGVGYSSYFALDVTDQ